MNFKELNLKDYILSSVEELNFKELTEIQEKVIPLALKNNQIIGKSQTGTGKTHSFLIPIFQKLNEEDKKVQALICAPTRELSTQIYNVAQQIAKHSDKDIDIRLYTGGTDRNKEIHRLQNSQPQIVIGTPGKIYDLAMKENVLKATTLNSFIIDEADMSLETGFLTDIDGLLGRMNKDIQIQVFSATIPVKLQHFLKKYLDSPEFVEIRPKQVTSVKLENVLISVKNKSKLEMLNQLTKTINPYICLVFCNTKTKVQEVYDFLKSKKLNVGIIHGDLTPRERSREMKKINALEYQYIVASDIASRGIDIQGVSHVVNYELPKDPAFYIHRIGRTARASFDGQAISFFEFLDDEYLDVLESKGVTFKYKAIINKELKDTKARNARKNREATTSDEVKQARIMNKSKIKVKPGYKKKYNENVQRTARKLRKKKR